MAQKSPGPVVAWMKLILDAVLAEQADAAVAEAQKQAEQEQAESMARLAAERMAAIEQFMVTSGFNFEGYTIAEYIGFISEETVLGMGLFRAVAADISNLTGLESKGLRTKLLQAKRFVMDRLRTTAFDMGANAIIGIDLDYTMFGDSLVGVIASGTAVRLKDPIT